ncbi:MAG: HNH endonuclease signature motif containing protein [Dehalococcoidales bacterium]|nr:HNH endonuclease signature motif containing protein [Dehalococcoidales bacterium]
MPYEYEETPEQILERIKLDIRRLEKNLKKENGQKSKRHLGLWVFPSVASVVLLGLISTWWEGNPIWWGLGTALVVAGIGFALIKYPAFRQMAWSVFKTAGKNLSESGEEQARRIRAHIPSEVSRRIEKRARGVCEHLDPDRCRWKDGLEFHHIDGDSSNSRYSNLILLCRNHHNRAKSGGGGRKKHYEDGPRRTRQERGTFEANLTVFHICL